MHRKRERVIYQSDLPSATQQHFKDECDINSVLERYRKTGHFNPHIVRKGQYGDFTGFSDFRSALQVVIEAQSSFDALPAHLRKRFGNDPQNLVDFLSDSKNNEEAETLGLIVSTPKAQKNDDLTTKNAPPIQDTPPAPKA